MTDLIGQVRSFNRPVQLLLLNQLTINIGFYMLMPYLAGYLSGELALTAWVVGLILGVRNFSQQGMFLLGGSLADRIGYKPMILAGLGLRVIGFALLGLAHSLPALIIASAMTGLAGALFNPAVRAYLAAEAGDRKVEAFAVFNVFYQAGILLGPLIGLALLTASFSWVCLVAAGLFLLLLGAQSRALPARGGSTGRREQSILADWRQVLGHRPFLLFSLVMIGSYVLNFQVYLALPIEVRRATGTEAGVAVLFALSGLLTVVGQVKLTRWTKARWTPTQAITRGLLLMGLAFTPLVLTASTDQTRPGELNTWPAYLLALAPVVVTTVLLTLATMVVYPFEMAIIITLAGEKKVGTYYGFYNTVSGVGIAAGNLLTGLAIDTGLGYGMPALPWLALVSTGAACAVALAALARRNHLDNHHQQPGAPALINTTHQSTTSPSR